MKTFTLIPTQTRAKFTPAFIETTPRVSCVPVLVKVENPETGTMERRREMEAEAGAAAAKIKAAWSFGEIVLNEKIDGLRVTVTAL